MLFFGVRIGLAVLLTLTAALKLFDAATILGSGGLLESPLRLSLAVGFEVFAAVVIAVAPPTVAHRFALLVFSSLACIAAWAWWTRTDCGCFGSRTPKGVPLIVDLMAITLLLACSRNVAKTENTENSVFRRRMIWPLGIAIAAGLFAAGATGWRIEQLSTEAEMPAWFGENLIGTRFPLLRDEKVAAVIAASTDVLVVMLRPGCDHCHEVAACWAKSGTERPDAVQVIGISVADGRWTVMPNEVSPTPMGSDDEFVISWENAEEPFVAAPTFIAIRDRVVIGVVTGDDASEAFHEGVWIQELFGGENE